LKTYDERGNLLGDTPPDAAPAAATSPAPALAIGPLDLSALLQPPHVYFLIAAVAVAVYLYERNR